MERWLAGPDLIFYQEYFSVPGPMEPIAAGRAAHHTAAVTNYVLVHGGFVGGWYWRDTAVAPTVYLCAFWPQRGQSLSDIFGDGSPPNWIVAHEDGMVTVTEDIDVARHALCADVEPERAAENLRRLSPQSLSSSAAPSTAPERRHPTTYIICEQDNANPPAAQEQMAAAADHIERLASSHQPMASMPDQLAAVLTRLK